MPTIGPVNASGNNQQPRPVVTTPGNGPRVVVIRILPGTDFNTIASLIDHLATGHENRIEEQRRRREERPGLVWLATGVVCAAYFAFRAIRNEI